MHNRAKTIRTAFFVLCAVIIFATTLSPTLGDRVTVAPETGIYKDDASNNIAARSASVKVYVDPPTSSVKVGQIFTVNVSIFNVTNLYGYKLTLYYNTTILDGRNVTLPLGHFLTPDINPENISIAKLEIDDTYNATHGRVWFNVTLLTPEPSKNGSGTLTTIEFEATEAGNTTLRVSGSLNDPQTNPITYEAIEGSVIVLERPTIWSVTNVTRWPNYNESVPIEANVTDDVANVSTVILCTRVLYPNDTTIWLNVTMAEKIPQTGLYNATIPAFPWKTQVQYKVYANSTDGERSSSPLYSYEVADYYPPIISDNIFHYPWGNPECNETVTVFANVTSEAENASPIRRVKLYYWNGSFLRPPLSEDFKLNRTFMGDLYVAEIPPLPWNTQVWYRVYAEDLAGNNAIKPELGEEKEYLVLDSYGPSISNLSHAPSSPQYNETVTVSANVSEPETGSGVSQVVLSYSNGTTWFNVTMVEEIPHPGLYNATIPAFPWNTIVKYKVYARDNATNWSISDVRTYTVTDSHAPTIGNLDWSPKEPKTNKPVDVTASVSEPTNASGTSLVILSYHNGSVWTNVTMASSNGVYTAQIPGLKNGTHVQFKIYARDNAGNWATSPVQEYTVKASEPSMILPLIVTIIILIVVATVAIVAMRKLKI